ncbi:hypothetical protein ACKWTF_003610 [Chironomus riparius]
MNFNQDECVGGKMKIIKHIFLKKLLPKITKKDCQKLTTSIAICYISINNSAQGSRVFFLLLSLFNKLSLHLHLKFQTNLSGRVIITQWTDSLVNLALFPTINREPMK